MEMELLGVKRECHTVLRDPLTYVKTLHVEMKIISWVQPSPFFSKPPFVLHQNAFRTKAKTRQRLVVQGISYSFTTSLNIAYSGQMLI